jgi:hypothetical protein
MDEADEDDIIARDAPVAADTPVWVLARLRCGLLALMSA